MEARIKKLINARAKAIQGFDTDVDTKRDRLFEYTFALHDAGLMTWNELVEFNAKPRFYDVEVEA